MSATELQALLRFLSQDAKVNLVVAMSKVKDLQKANLDTPEKLAKAKVDNIKEIFPDEKIAKQILTAAKRVSKKRAAGDDSTSSPTKKRKESLFADDTASPAEVEASLELPYSMDSEEDLEDVVLFTNRAPLALAFVFTLLKYTMPEQPLSSRLSLAQGYISITSKARALYLGIDTGRSAEEEGFGEGQPSVMITGKEIKVLRRWGYEWKESKSSDVQKDEPKISEQDTETKADSSAVDTQTEEQPPLWALDLEALKKSNTLDSVPSLGQTKSGGQSNLPVHTPQSARAYLLKAFDTAPADGDGQPPPKKSSATAKVAEKERNLGKLLRVLDLLYQSWVVALSPEDLDKRTWGWYVKVRPGVAEGAAGWGGKNTLKLADVLALRRQG